MVFEEIAKPVTGLAGQKCLPCTGKVSVLLTLEESSEYLDQLGGDWKIAASSWYSGLVWNLQKTFKLTDFASAMKFIAAVGKIAEEEQHHPDFALIRYSYVQISIFTRTINGLSINDFIVAAKIDALVK
jgi:4a-hydroxytetrahydrobiopterin dehydratase